MPLRIFKDLSNLSALSVCACDALVFNSVAYFLPLYFQIVLGKSPSSSGVLMLALAIPLAIVSLTSGHIIERTGRLLEVLQSGLLLMTIGIGLLISLDSTPNLGKAIGFMIVVGLGFGPNFGAPLIALQTRIRSSDIAAGTSAFSFVRMVSGAIGVVVGQVIFQLLMKPQQDTFVKAGVSQAFAELLTGGESISQVHSVSQLSETQRHIVRLGFVKALRGAWVFCTVVSAIGLLVSFGIKRTKLSRDKQPAAVESLVENVTEGERQRNSTAAEADVV
jgi:MFS family permease